MTIFGRNRNKKEKELPFLEISDVSAVVDSPSEYNKKQRRKTVTPTSSECDEQESSEKKIKLPKYQIVCLPLDTRSGRLLLVTKADDSNVWVLPKWNASETQSAESIAHGIALNIAGVEGRLTSHIGEFTQLAKKKRVKAYINAYELQCTSVLNDYECNETRSRRWFTYVDAMQALADKPFQQNILRHTSIAPKF
ncbi:unnamed protein product [Umbelopsis vinacea]